jgi:hypothetical protein
MNPCTHNIGLQRTSACGLAAEAGSFGVGERRLALLWTVSGLLAIFAPAISARAGDIGCLSSIQGELHSSEPKDHREAVEALMNQTDGEWLGCTGIVEQLKVLLTDPAENVQLRGAILDLFQMRKAFDRVKPIASELASKETAPEMAREAASALAFDALDYQSPSRLEALFKHSTGILREEAAITIGRQSLPITSEQARQAVMRELERVFNDTRLSPRTRGDALEAAGFFRREPFMIDALVEMLSPDHWFFGAQGQHWLVHSLVPTIGSLYSVKSDLVRRNIEAVGAKLGQLPENQRADVEAELRIWRQAK